MNILLLCTLSRRIADEKDTERSAYTQRHLATPAGGTCCSVPGWKIPLSRWTYGRHAVGVLLLSVCVATEPLHEPRQRQQLCLRALDEASSYCGAKHARRLAAATRRAATPPFVEMIVRAGGGVEDRIDLSTFYPAAARCSLRLEQQYRDESCID
jgi:hypothetical protein